MLRSPFILGGVQNEFSFRRVTNDFAIDKEAICERSLLLNRCIVH